MSAYHSFGNIKKNVVILFAIAIFGTVFYFLSQSLRETAPKPLSPEEIMARQVEELDKLREQATNNPFTEEEKKRQLEELNKLNEQNRTNPLSPEEINRQFEELDKLRSQSNN